MDSSARAPQGRAAQTTPGERLKTRTSQRGEIARDGGTIALAQRSHESRHVEIVGPLVPCKGAHRRVQILIAEPGEPRRWHAALEVRLMAGLALRNALGRRGRLGCGALRGPR